MTGTASWARNDSRLRGMRSGGGFTTLVRWRAGPSSCAQQGAVSWSRSGPESRASRETGIGSRDECRENGMFSRVSCGACVSTRSKNKRSTFWFSKMLRVSVHLAERQTSSTAPRITAHKGLITAPHGSVSPTGAKRRSILSICKEEKWPSNPRELSLIHI